MPSASTPQPEGAAGGDGVRPRAARAKRTLLGVARDLLSMTKPRITLVVLATSSAGIALAPGHVPPARLLFSLLGTVLVVSAANALNMWWERDVDGAMERTRDRPLPAGRIDPTLALAFGLALGAVAVPLLFAAGALVGLLGLFALVSYVAVYTPLKRQTPFALHVGAVPGAIPPLLGWTTVTGRLDMGGLALFALLLVWQLPHFLAISLFHGADYARAGLRVYVVERGVRATKGAIVLYAALLLVVSLAPVPLGLAGNAYLVCAMVAGALFIAVGALGLARDLSDRRWARSVFGYSILYLTVLLGTLVADHLGA